MKYLFLNWNNGHYKSYHPFITDLLLNQEMVTKKLEKISGAHRHGTYVEHLIEILLDEGYQADYWTCDCCGNITKEIKNPNLDKWVILEGIMGNY